MLMSRVIIIVLATSGFHVLASCSEPPRLAESSVTVQVDGPERIEGRRAFVTQTLTNTGSEPVCFMYEADLGFVPGGFTDHVTGQDYSFYGETFTIINAEGQIMPMVSGVKTRIEPGQTFIRRGLSTSIDEFRLYGESGQPKPYRSGDLVVFGSGEQFFPCFYDDIIDARVNYIVVEGTSRPFAFN
jgi:hypothetical protein